MRYSRPAATTLAASVLFVTACGSDSSTLDTADRFVEVSGFDRSIDYEPLASPEAAIEQADVVIVGTVRSLREGMTVSVPVEQTPAPDAAEMEDPSVPEVDRVTEADAKLPAFEPRFQTTALSVEVADVVKGDPRLLGEVVEVHVYRSPLTSFEEVSEAAFTGAGVFVLEDVTDWSPMTGATFQNRPDGTILIPYTDGAWFEGAEGPVAVEAHHFAEPWGDPGSVGAIADLLRSAASSG